jgi:hypothetical protein
MSEGATKLQYALKNLRARWEDTQDGWSDQVRQTFEDKHLRPLETQVTATIRGMEKLSEVMMKVRQDCS